MEHVIKYSKKIFREYDIRGVYQEDYNSNFAELLSTATSNYLSEVQKPFNGRSRYKVAVGRDCRLSGPEIAEKFINGFLNQGIDVVYLGVVPTPLVYFSSFELDVDAAVSITGSHNPAEYNGFKTCFGKNTLHGDQIQHLYQHCQKIQNSGGIQTKAKRGELTEVDIISKYQNFIRSKISIKRKLKVVVDSGNGTASTVAPELLKSLGCEVIPLYCELDGNFPNHHPDPTVPENLRDLQKVVLENHADIGIAYDGDSDRIGAVDEKANTIFGDELLVLYAREILSRKPGAKIISEVKSSHRLYNDIRKHGGNAIMWKTGHSLIKAKMKEEKAELAGEMSGHVFFADQYLGYDDAIYASVRLVQLVAAQEKGLSVLLSDLPKTVCTPELRVDCEDELKFQVVDTVKNILKKKYTTIDIDGVRVETEKGWGLLRASNTQPVVVMRFEAQNSSDLNELRKVVETAFQEAYKEAQNGRLKNPH